MQEGWVCPKCGAVMSPSFPVCWYCSKGTGAVRMSSGTDAIPAPCDHVWDGQITTSGQFSTCEKCGLTRMIALPPGPTTTSGTVDA
jgi:hypothetical protein